MAKIAFIGAGSIVFTRALCSDILLAPALRDDACISLMDIDPHRLEQGRELVQRLDELAPRFGSKGQSGWFDFGRTGGYLRNCLYWAEHHDQEFRSLIDGSKPLPTARSHEYGSYIIEAIETGQPARINGNVPNTGLVSNLPEGCCVEVPCLVDSTGVHGVHAGPLPPQLAALNRTNVNVQELIVEAALTGKVDAVYHAVMLDPLTAAVSTLPQIRSMTGELLAAQSAWLPQFRELR